MTKIDLYILKGKTLITLSVILIVMAGYIEFYKLNSYKENTYTINYENINIKDMATANVYKKEQVEKKSYIGEILNNYQKLENSESPKEVNLPATKDSIALKQEERRIWYLPCEVGNITHGINYSHFAIDITSPRGESEVIYPVANGVISGIYQDSAGAKIVTVNHSINNVNYTSQYVHLSSYAKDLYVGKAVTVNDYLGYMGSTGTATATHLHLAVLDCSIFDTNDNNCSNLGSFFNYGTLRLSQGFYGLYSVMDVPSSWNSR